MISMAKKSRTAEVTLSLYIPGWKGESKAISEKEFSKKIRQAEKYLTETFGNCTTNRIKHREKGPKTSGTLLSRVARLDVMTDKITMKRKLTEFDRFVYAKKKQWGQKFISVTVNDDVMQY